MGPANAATLAQLSLGRLDNLGPLSLIQPFGREHSDREFCALVEHPYRIFRPHHVDVCPAGFGHSFQILPNAATGVRIQAVKFAVTVHAMNVIALNDGSRNAAMETVGVSLAGPAVSWLAMEPTPSSGLQARKSMHPKQMLRCGNTWRRRSTVGPNTITLTQAISGSSESAKTPYVGRSGPTGLLFNVDMVAILHRQNLTTRAIKTGGAYAAPISIGPEVHSS